MKLPPFFAVFLLASGLAGAGCARAPSGEAAAGAVHFHQDVAPHGGTPVALGEDYNVELVRDAEAGTLSAYVLDDEMEEFVRSPSPAIAIDAKVGGEDRTLVLTAVANPATGETVGDTSLFQAQADWIKGAAKFSGKLRSITVRGTAFTAVPFDFPGAARP